MTGAGGVTLTRAVSRDGTEIGFFSSGQGPPLLLVHGATADHATAWPALRPYLEPHATVHAMDRRGRGASGDADGYQLAREFEDVAAVVEALAQATGSAVDVLGHSYGGLCALGAAGLTPHIRRLVLYEGWPLTDPDLAAPPPEVTDRLAALVAVGEHDAMVDTFLRHVARIPAAQVEMLRSQPTWQNRVAAAPTVPREFRAFRSAVFDPRSVEQVMVPSLLIVGAESEGWLDQATAAAEALPDAQVAVLDGHAHIAHLVAPELFADTVLAFLRDR